MRDRLFFPLALALVMALVAIAFLPRIGRLPTGAVASDGMNYSRIEISGAYLNKVISGGEAVTRLERGPEGKYLLFIEAEKDALADSPELGPHFRLAGDIELQLAGHRVRVTVRARPAADRGAQKLRLNYSAGRAGDSGWRTFDLAPEFSDLSFEYDLPAIIGETGVDYLAIRPDVPEKPRAIIVERVVIERLARVVVPPA